MALRDLPSLCCDLQSDTRQGSERKNDLWTRFAQPPRKGLIISPKMFPYRSSSEDASTSKYLKCLHERRRSKTTFNTFFICRALKTLELDRPNLFLHPSPRGATPTLQGFVCEAARRGEGRRHQGTLQATGPNKCKLSLPLANDIFKQRFTQGLWGGILLAPQECSIYYLKRIILPLHFHPSLELIKQNGDPWMSRKREKKREKERQKERLKEKRIRFSDIPLIEQSPLRPAQPAKF